MFYYLWRSSTKDCLNPYGAHKKCFFPISPIILPLSPSLSWYWSIRDERTLSGSELALSNLSYTMNGDDSDYLLWGAAVKSKKTSKRPLQVRSKVRTDATA